MIKCKAAGLFRKRIASIRYSPAAIQMSKNSAERKIQCPRCGYDLRGVMSLWQESCPLLGKCSECGLDYEWSIVTQPEKYEPQWCVEFSPGWRSVLKSSFKTYCCSFVPWLFWSRISMSHEVRKRRLIAYLCCFLLPLLLSYVLIQSSAAIYVRYKAQQDLDEQNAQLPQQIQEWKDDLAGMNWEEEVQYLPEEQRDEAKVRWKKAMQEQLKYLVQQQTNLPVLHQSYPKAVYEAVFNPASWYSTGYYLYPNNRTYQYYSPIELHEIILYDIASFVGPYFTEEYILYELAIPVAIVGVAGIGLLIAFPFSFVLLPQSRKRAKVQWRHIARIAVYSAYIPFTSILCFVLLYIVGALAIIVGLSEDLIASVVIWGGMSVWLMLIVWWAVAIKRYLKMPHGIAIAVLLSILNFLVMATAIGLLVGAFTTNFWVKLN